MGRQSKKQKRNRNLVTEDQRKEQGERKDVLKYLYKKRRGKQEKSIVKWIKTRLKQLNQED